MPIPAWGVGCDGDGRRVTGLTEGEMTDRKKLGMCNYCQSLGPVYEQENDQGTPTFLICHNCITDVFVGIEQDGKRKAIRQRHNLKWDQWMNQDRNNSGE